LVATPYVALRYVLVAQVTCPNSSSRAACCHLSGTQVVCINYINHLTSLKRCDSRLSNMVYSSSELAVSVRNIKMILSLL